MKRFESCIIPDAELDAYLADKLTVKPDYDATIGDVEVKSDYEALRQRMAADRKKNNEAVTRSHRLKK